MQQHGSLQNHYVKQVSQEQVLEGDGSQIMVNSYNIFHTQVMRKADSGVA